MPKAISVPVACSVTILSVLLAVQTKIPMYLLAYVHELTGVPWWASIVVTTVLFRTIMFPLMIMQLKNTHGLTQARPEIDKVRHLRLCSVSTSPFGAQGMIIDYSSHRQVRHT